MPEPISSQAPAPLSSSPDPTLDEGGLVCRAAPAGPPPPPTPPVAQLMSRLPSATGSLPPTAPPAPADTNAQRTSEKAGIGHYADVNVTGSADALYAGAAALKGRDPSSGLEVEVFSVSAQAGWESDYQAGMARLGVSKDAGSVTAEFFTARAHGGVHNDDGSTGFNIGAGATAASIESTYGEGGASITAGAGLSLGVDLSVGRRDADHDGRTELCVKASVGFLTLGACAEKNWGEPNVVPAPGGTIP